MNDQSPLTYRVISWEQQSPKAPQNWFVLFSFTHIYTPTVVEVCLEPLLIQLGQAIFHSQCFYGFWGKNRDIRETHHYTQYCIGILAKSEI